MFEPIMGVGKTPMITEDITNLNPYGIANDEIASYCVLTTVLGGTTPVEAGSVLNIINPFFDYSNNTAYAVSNGTPGLASTVKLTIDIGKRVILRSFELYCSFVDTAPPLAMSVAVSYSYDGVTYIPLQTVFPTNTDYTFKYTDLAARFFKVDCNLSPGGTGVATIKFNQLSIKADSKQFIIK